MTYRASLTLLLSLFSLTLLSGCNEASETSSGSGATTPEILAVHTRFRTNTSDYDEEFNSTLTYYVEIADEAGLERIEKIEVKSPDQEYWTTIHDTAPSTPEEDQKDILVDEGFFSSINYYRTSPALAHKRPLRDHQIRVTNRSGGRATSTFDLTLPEAWGDGSETFLYDYAYAGGDTGSGIQGLGFGTLNNLIVTDEKVSFDLTVTDHRTEEILVLFYTYDPWAWLGSTHKLTKSDFVTGGTNSFEFDPSDSEDFELADGVSISNATHYFVVGYGPAEPVEIAGQELDLRSFLSWGGYLPISD